MHDAMVNSKKFPDMLLEMVAAGEQTGAVDELLNQVADHYDGEIETTLAGLTSLLEPILILFLGVVVGGVVIAMFLPIFRMTDAVQF
jgi:type IV pilus assembly protein PilC